MKTLELSDLILFAGNHDKRENGVCLLEAAAWLAGEAHSDHPGCVERVRAAFGRRLNDARWPGAADRTAALKPILPVLIGTADRHDSSQVRYFFADKAVRTWAPMAFALRGFQAAAETMRNIKPIVSKETAREACEICLQVKKAAYADAAYADAAADADAADADAAAAADAAADAADAAAYADAAPYAAAARLKVLNAAADALRETCEPGFAWPGGRP